MVGVASMVNTNTSTPILRLLSYLVMAVSQQVRTIYQVHLLNISRAKDSRSSATV